MTPDMPPTPSTAATSASQRSTARPSAKQLAWGCRKYSTGSTRTIGVTIARDVRPPANAGCAHHSTRLGSPKPKSGRPRATSRFLCGTSPRLPVCPAGSRTAQSLHPTDSAKWPPASVCCETSVFGSAASATSRQPHGSRSTSQRSRASGVRRSTRSSANDFGRPDSRRSRSTRWGIEPGR